MEGLVSCFINGMSGVSDLPGFRSAVSFQFFPLPVPVCSLALGDDQDVTPQPSPLPARKSSGDGSAVAAAVAAAAAAAASLEDALETTLSNHDDAVDDEEEEIEVERESTIILESTLLNKSDLDSAEGTWWFRD